MGCTCTHWRPYPVYTRSKKTSHHCGLFLSTYPAFSRLPPVALTTVATAMIQIWRHCHSQELCGGSGNYYQFALCARLPGEAVQLLCLSCLSCHFRWSLERTRAVQQLWMSSGLMRCQGGRECTLVNSTQIFLLMLFLLMLQPTCALINKWVWKSAASSRQSIWSSTWSLPRSPKCHRSG